MRIAITRAVSPNIGQCELTHLDRQPIDLALARTEHHQYEATLAALGCQVIQLPAEPALPDSVFVEDTAVVLDEVAIITRPGADSRKPETISIAQALAPYRTLCTIEAPGTVDGGDVLRIDKRLYVGLSSRSNQAAIEQMAGFLQPFGYTVQEVPVNGFLHLKSAVTQVAAATVLINPAWVDAKLFGHMKIIEIDPTEAYAANTLLIGETVIYPISYPRTQRRLEQAGISVQTVDVAELIKAEGAVTCCSLIFSL
jgi:dimethylargininase